MLSTMLSIITVIKLYHTWLYMFEAPDDGWMWHPKQVEWTIAVK
jgi:hypothetical protein